MSEGGEGNEGWSEVNIESQAEPQAESGLEPRLANTWPAKKDEPGEMGVPQVNVEDFREADEAWAKTMKEAEDEALASQKVKGDPLEDPARGRQMGEYNEPSLSLPDKEPRFVIDNPPEPPQVGSNLEQPRTVIPGPPDRPSLTADVEKALGEKPPEQNRHFWDSWMDALNGSKDSDK